MKLFFTGSLMLVCAFSTTLSLVEKHWIAAVLYAVATFFLWNKLWNSD